MVTKFKYFWALFAFFWVFQCSGQHYIRYTSGLSVGQVNVDKLTSNQNLNANIGVDFNDGIFRTGITYDYFRVLNLSDPKHFNMAGIYAQYGQHRKRFLRAFIEVSATMGNYGKNSDNIATISNNTFYIGPGAGLELRLLDFLHLVVRGKAHVALNNIDSNTSEKFQHIPAVNIGLQYFLHP